MCCAIESVCRRTLCAEGSLNTLICPNPYVSITEKFHDLLCHLLTNITRRSLLSHPIANVYVLKLCFIIIVGYIQNYTLLLIVFSHMKTKLRNTFCLFLYFKHITIVTAVNVKTLKMAIFRNYYKT